MKKFVFAICLVLLLKPVLPVFEYALNYQYITNELCENRDNFVMGCNGKCYLMKELAKASETEKPLSTDKKHLVSETNDLFFADFQNYEFTPFTAPTPIGKYTYTNLYAHLAESSAFHPPTIIS